MRADSGVAIIVAAVVGIAAAAASGRAQTNPWVETPAYALVEDCGDRAIELAPDRTQHQMVWREFGEPVDMFAQVIAFSNGRPGDPRQTNTRGLYQCTELVHRYLRQTFAIPTRIGLGLGNGVDLAGQLANRFGGARFQGGITGSTPVSLRYQGNGQSACRPVVGSIVSVAMAYPDGAPSPGHVAIIRALEPEGFTLMARMFEQHGGAPLQPGEPYAEGRVRFEYRDGAWWGTYLSPGGGSWPVKGWTSVVVRDGPVPVKVEPPPSTAAPVLVARTAPPKPPTPKPSPADAPALTQTAAVDAAPETPAAAETPATADAPSTPAGVNSDPAGVSATVP